MVCASLQATWLGATMIAMLYCDSFVVKTIGKRSAGKPHAAFDEGGQGVTLASTLPDKSCSSYSRSNLPRPFDDPFVTGQFR